VHHLQKVTQGEVKSPQLFNWTTGVGLHAQKREFKQGINPKSNLGGFYHENISNLQQGILECYERK
jgi:hypothetical protein